MTLRPHQKNARPMQQENQVTLHVPSRYSTLHFAKYFAKCGEVHSVLPGKSNLARIPQTVGSGSIGGQLTKLELG